MNQSNKVLYSFTWEKGYPTHSDLEVAFDIPKHAMDSEFGIVEISREDKLYCILVESEYIKNYGSERAYSNPKIEGFHMEEE